MTKKHIRACLIGVRVLTALFWISPYWAIAGMAKAAQAGDAELLADYIDLPSLKDSVRGQAKSHMRSEMRKSTTDGWAMLGMALGSVIIDKVVDEMLTPEAIAKLLSPHLVDLNVSRAVLTANLIASSQGAWVNGDTFRIAVEKKSHLTWRRQGLTWHLTSVALPLDPK